MKPHRDRLGRRPARASCAPSPCAFATSITPTAWDDEAKQFRGDMVGRVNADQTIADHDLHRPLPAIRRCCSSRVMVQSQAVMLATNHVFMIAGVVDGDLGQRHLVRAQAQGAGGLPARPTMQSAGGPMGVEHRFLPVRVQDFEALLQGRARRRLRALRLRGGLRPRPGPGGDRRRRRMRTKALLRPARRGRSAATTQPAAAASAATPPSASRRPRATPAVDLKEFWHTGRELPPGHPYRAYMPDNVWPTEVEGFQARRRRPVRRPGRPGEAGAARPSPAIWGSTTASSTSRSG